MTLNRFIFVFLCAALFCCVFPAGADTDNSVSDETAAVNTAPPPHSAAAADVDADTDNDNDNADDRSSTPVAAEPAPLKNEIPRQRMPSIKVTVSPEKGAIGDLIEWKVEVHKKSAGDRVVLPAALDFGLLDIQTRDLGEHSADTAMTQVMSVGLVGFETGEYDIPPQKLTVVDDKGNISEVMTRSFKVTIESLIANEPEPALKKDEGEGEVVMVEDYTLLYILIGVGAVILISLLTLLGRKLWSMRKPKPGPPPPPPRPAHELAFEKLNALRTSGYLDEQMHKTFHLKLSEAFREYLENRFGFLALEQSTREIAAELKRQSLTVELHRQVVQLLEDTDLVKFAKYEPPKEESEKLLDEAFRMVELTRQKAEAGRKVSDDGGLK